MTEKAKPAEGRSFQTHQGSPKATRPGRSGKGRRSRR